MSTTRLHYFHDPLCGWCYAVAPLVRAARHILPVVGHGGGLFAGEKSMNVSPEFRSHATFNDQKIAELTGQFFGEPYKNVLLKDDSVKLDSEPPTTAILAAEYIDGRGLEMLSALQRAHYVRGMYISEKSVLMEIAEEMSFDRAAFQSAYDNASGKVTHTHIHESRILLGRVGGRGFPTFAMEKEGQMERLEFTPYLGNADQWQLVLRSHRGLALDIAAVGIAACGADGCAI